MHPQTPHLPLADANRHKGEGQQIQAPAPSETSTTSQNTEDVMTTHNSEAGNNGDAKNLEESGTTK